MSTPIRRLTVAQFALLALPLQLTRKIVAVHLHHTWRPRRQDFRGLATIEAMRRVHMEHNGWSDMAQHLTIDPQGGLWTGRNWNLAPASATPHNGTSQEGPFMIEIVGDFDKAQDPFDGAQRTAVVAVVAHLLRTFGLNDDALKFHNQLTNQKSCPGSSIDRGQLLKDIHQLPAGRKVKTPSPGLFRVEHLLGADAVRGGLATDNAASFSVPENATVAHAIETAAREGSRNAQRRDLGLSPRVLGLNAFDTSRDTDDSSTLKPHVINLARGELSESGAFRTTPGDVEAIVDAIRDYAEETETPRLMIYAHGGLVSEGKALEYAKAMVPWWRAHGVYPVFFVWETSLLEILGQFVAGRRDIFDFTSDPIIEAIVKAPGTAAWAGMKESARLAASLDTGEGAIGGARLFGRKLAALVKGGKGLPVHTVGHSAGAIFHAQLIPVLLAEGLPAIEHLYLLAPAARTELFAEQLAALIAAKTVRELSVFTMEEDAEEQDNCFQAYRKSLLYLVSHACEGLKRRPILGLHRSLRKDAALRTLFGLNADGTLNGQGTAHLHFSFAKGKAENPLTRALAHGAFDNDPKTMSAVLRRIVGVADETGLGEPDFPFPPLSRAFDFALPSSAPPGDALSVSPVAASSPGVAGRPGGSRLKALCIGINNYPVRPLDGCVNDARRWGAALTQLGAQVDYLFDGDATADGLKNAIRALVRGGTAGDVLVLQYSGHGGQLPTRVDSEADGFNEALIPVDFNTGALLVDDELADILRELAAGVSMTLFMDCCHSGTNSRFAPIMRARALAGDKPRFMPLDDDVVEAYFARRGARGLTRAGDMSLPGIVHYAACQDHELAWESNGQGDFTAAAAAALAAAVRSATSNERLAADLAAAVGAKNRQHPQLMDIDPSMRNRAVLAGPVR